MKSFKLDSMTRGWFVGDFQPTAFRTKGFEVCCRSYAQGDREGRHVHRIATELTLVVSGSVRMNGESFGAGDIVVLEPGEPTDFEAVTDTLTVVVKSPSAPDDKYPIL